METKEQGSQENPLVKRISRRDLLKGGAATGILALLTGSLTSSDREKKEHLRKMAGNLVMVDFAPENPVSGIEQEKYPSNTRLKRLILGDKYRSPLALIREFGFNFLDRKKLKEQVFKKYPEVAIVYGVFDKFRDHGINVASIIHAIWQRNGLASETSIIPLQNLINPAHVEFSEDELGNHVFAIQLEPEPFIRVLERYPDQKVVNLSLQMGKLGFAYQEKFKGFPLEETEPGVWREKTEAEPVIYLHETPWVIVEGGYTGEETERNLLKLFKICNAFPGKFFIAAGGNYRDNISEARKALADSWPVNLLLVAEYNDKAQLTRDLVSGADIYVDNQALGLPAGSSFSTPVISGLASIFINKGITMSEVKQKILALCEIKTHKPYKHDEPDYEEEIKVLNPEKIKLD